MRHSLRRVCVCVKRLPCQSKPDSSRTRYYLPTFFFVVPCVSRQFWVLVNFSNSKVGLTETAEHVLDHCCVLSGRVFHYKCRGWVNGTLTLNKRWSGICRSGFLYLTRQLEWLFCAFLDPVSQWDVSCWYRPVGSHTPTRSKTSLEIVITGAVTRTANLQPTGL